MQNNIWFQTVGVFQLLTPTDIIQCTFTEHIDPHILSVTHAHTRTHRNTHAFIKHIETQAHTYLCWVVRRRQQNAQLLFISRIFGLPRWTESPYWFFSLPCSDCDYPFSHSFLKTTRVILPLFSLFSSLYHSYFLKSDCTLPFHGRIPPWPWELNYSIDHSCWILGLTKAVK